VTTTLDISCLGNGDVIPSDKDEFQAINEVSSDKSSDNTDFHAINQISSDKSNQKQEDVEKELLTILADKQEHSVSELAKVVGLSPARTRAITAELVSKGLISCEEIFPCEGRCFVSALRIVGARSVAVGNVVREHGTPESLTAACRRERP